MKTSIYTFLTLSIGLLQISCAQEKEKNSAVQKFPFTDANWSIIDKEGVSQPMDTTIYDNKKALHLPVGHAAYLFPAIPQIRMGTAISLKRTT